MATKKISALTAVTNAAGSDEFVIVQGGVTYRATRAKNASKGADIASAATTDIGAATGEYVEVTGTTTITSFGTVATGTKRVVRFMGGLTLTYNATSLILPTSANITTVADDIGEFISLGSGSWICSRFSRKNGNTLTVGSTAITMVAKSIVETEGAAVASAATADIWAVADGNTVHITGTTTITSFGTAPQAGAWMKVIFDGELTLTHGANLNLQGSANITTKANDFAFVYADTTTLFRVIYFPSDATSPTLASTISFSVNKNGTNQTAVVSATPTLVTWSTVTWDTNSVFASNKFTPVILGKYFLAAGFQWTAFADGVDTIVKIYKNGALHKQVIIVSGSAATQGACIAVVVEVLVSTDYFEVYAQQGSGTDKIIDGTAAYTWFMGHKIN